MTEQELIEDTKELQQIKNLWDSGAPIMARERLRNMITKSTHEGDLSELKIILAAMDDDPKIGGKWEGNFNVPAKLIAKMNGGVAPTWADLYAKADENERRAMDKQMEEARARGW